MPVAAWLNMRHVMRCIFAICDRPLWSTLMQTLKYLQAACVAVTLSFSVPALADDDQDLEGQIESINQQAQSFVVNGKTIHTDDRTDYDDELNQFSDLKVGQRVEVDYVMRDGNMVAEEIELDD